MRSNHSIRWVLSCEHASSAVPRSFRACLSSNDAQAALHSHRGCDWGARPVARYLAKRLTEGSAYLEGSMSRLLIDLNRTESHPRLFSEWSKRLDAPAQQTLLDYYHQHLKALAKAISTASRTAHVRHLAVHSFTPVFNGKQRSTEIGLLFDPARAHEAAWAEELRWQLRQRSELRVHMNRPYRGTSDGLTQFFRARWGDERYAGLELEISQALIETPRQIRAMNQLLSASLFPLL